MLVDRDLAARVIGWIAPSSDSPGFVVPLFRSRGANRLLTQVADVDDRITAFSPSDPSKYHELPAIEDEHRIGDHVLWGYAFSGEAPYLGRRDDVASWLADRVDGISDPLLQLQAIEFCELGPQMRDAWRRAYARLETVSPRSAAAWRDVVVMPTRLRYAVRQTAIDHGIVTDVRETSRNVDVRIEGDRVHLMLEPALYAGFVERPKALAALKRETKSVRSAFQLELVTEPRSVQAADDDRSGPTQPIIAANGLQALVVLQAAGLEPFRKLRDYRFRSAMFHRAPLVVTRGDRLLYQDDGSNGSMPPTGFLNAVAEPREVPLVFVLDFAATDPQLVIDACGMARKLGGEDRRLIALVVHLPTVSSENHITGDLQKELVRTFDQICFISDQSPYARGSQALGPARSTAAAASRLKAMLSRIADGRFRPGRGVHEDFTAAPVSVFSSAYDLRLDLPKLCEQALVRADDPMLQNRGSFASVETDVAISPKDRSGIEHLFLQEELDDDEVELRRMPVPPFKSSGRLAEVLLVNVGWRTAELSEFDLYCRDRLEHHGWTLNGSRSSAIDWTAVRDDAAIDMIASQGRLSPKVVRNRRRKGGFSDDVVVLTKEPVRRRQLAEGLLSNVLPLHYSRIRALEPIYRRRHAILIGVLQKPSKVLERLLLRRAFEELEAKSPLALGTGPAGAVTESGARKAWRLATVEPDIVYRARDGIRLEFEVIEGDDESSQARRHPAYAILLPNGWETSNLPQV